MYLSFQAISLLFPEYSVNSSKRRVLQDLGNASPFCELLSECFYFGQLLSFSAAKKLLTQQGSGEQEAGPAAAGLEWSQILSKREPLKPWASLRTGGNVGRRKGSRYGVFRLVAWHLGGIWKQSCAKWSGRQWERRREGSESEHIRSRGLKA